MKSRRGMLKKNHLLALNPYDSSPSDSDDNAHDAENKW